MAIYILFFTLTAPFFTFLGYILYHILLLNYTNGRGQLSPNEGCFENLFIFSKHSPTQKYHNRLPIFINAYVIQCLPNQFRSDFINLATLC